MTSLLRISAPLLVFFLHLAVAANAIRLKRLESCLGASISLYTPSTQKFSHLKELSFRSNRASPLAIVTAHNEWHVAKTVRCARKVSIRVCARSGGHSLTGSSLCNGLVLDLSRMRRVEMQPGNVALIQPGANMGEVVWALHKKRRWMAAGVCPSVGFAGYVLGGGHSPYEGRLGLACDSMLSFRMVDRFGKVVVANRKKRSMLFWAMCGAGGGHFGIVTAFRWRTVSSKPFDRAVVFRFKWPAKRGGELLEKWQRYDEWGGNIWFRMEVYLAKREEGVFGYGACYDVKSVAGCLRRLNHAPFFKTAGRSTTYISKARNALDVQAFFGPEGSWGERRASNLHKAMLQQREIEGSAANDRSYQSTFMKMRNGKTPSRQFWQEYVNFCQSVFGRQSIPWVVCEMNLFNNAIDKVRNNAFAFRGANLITHYIVGGGTAAHKKFAYYWMKRHLAPFTIGVYVNYAELELGNYAEMYWGDSLATLKRVQKWYDPGYFFMNSQPIPK
ncbi:unnamed protein product [Agarophyton chilense]